MKQQFLKNFKTKKVSRVLLNKFVERIAWDRMSQVKKWLNHW
jgi:hypothetical protein